MALIAERETSVDSAESGIFVVCPIPKREGIGSKIVPGDRIIEALLPELRHVQLFAEERSVGVYVWGDKIGALASADSRVFTRMDSFLTYLQAEDAENKEHEHQ